MREETTINISELLLSYKQPEQKVEMSNYDVVSALCNVKNDIVKTDDPRFSKEFVHPNDMISVAMAKKLKTNDNSQDTPIIRAPNLGRMAWEQDRANKYYGSGLNYINQRGPMHVDMPNPKFNAWISRFNDGMNKELNDPVCMGAPYWEKYNESPDFDKIEYEDKEYDRMKEQMIAMRNFEEDMKSSRIELAIKNNPVLSKNIINMDEDIARMQKEKKRLKPSERMERKHNHTTPWINLRHVKENHNGIFYPNEYQSAYNNNSALYNQQMNIMMGNHQNMNNFVPDDTVNNSCVLGTRSSLNPNTGMINYSGYTTPQYKPGVGYLNMGGYPDVNGIPTVWFDDGGLCFRRTTIEKRRYGELKVVLYKSKEDADASMKKIEQQDEIERKYRKQRYAKNIKDMNIMIIYDTINEHGMHNYKIYSDKKGRMLTEDETNEKIHSLIPPGDVSDPVYQRLIKDTYKQYEEDDFINIVSELSRYNTYNSDMVGFLGSTLKKASMDILKYKCKEQIYKYRDKDPLALYKSTVMMIGDNGPLIVTVNKPSQEGEIADEIKRNYDKFTDNGKKALKNISKCKTVLEELEYLKTMRNFEVIKPEEDELTKFIKEFVLPQLSDNDIERLTNYRIYKSAYLIGNKGKDLKQLEQDYDNWWNYPGGMTKDMEEEEYEQRYADKMRYLTRMKEMEADKTCMTMQEYSNKLMIDRARLLINMSEGLLNKPNMTEEDIRKGVNYARAKIFEYENRYNSCPLHPPLFKREWFHQALRDRLEASKKYGGLDPAAAAIYLPTDPDDPYQNVDFSGVNGDPEGRRQRFVDRIFKRIRRPSI